MMQRLIVYLVLTTALAACSGIPLRSIPRLLQLQNELLNINPAEFMLAIQVDARMTPPPGAAPTLHLTIRPGRPDAPGAFETVERSLPMAVRIAAAPALGLAPAPAGRRWLIYSFPPAAQDELARIQTRFKRLQTERRDQGGVSLALGIAQEGVATQDPALAHTRWESWLQTSQKKGFFELWSGAIADLIKQARDQAKAER